MAKQKAKGGTMVTYNTETGFKGLPLSGGVALAKVCLFNERRHQNLPVRQVERKDVDQEKVRVQKARLLVKEKLDALIEKFLTDTKAVTPKPNPDYDPKAKAPPRRNLPQKATAPGHDQRLKMEAASDAGV